MFKTIKNAWSLPDLRKKILFTLLIIVVFRIGSVIQVAFLDTAALRSVMNPDDWSNTMLSYMNTLSGGAFSNATLFAMGITPYINRLNHHPGSSALLFLLWRDWQEKAKPADAKSVLSLVM